MKNWLKKLWRHILGEETTMLDERNAIVTFSNHLVSFDH